MVMVEALEVARAIFPQYDDELLQRLIWEETGFPDFFMGNPRDELHKQLLAASSQIAYDAGQNTGIEEHQNRNFGFRADNTR